MKAFSLHGPLAHYQRQVCELQGTIEQLQSSEVKLQQELVQKEQELVNERNLSRQLQHSRVPDLQNQIAALSHTVQELQAQVVAQRSQQRETEATAAAAVAALQTKLDTATADNALLRSELSKTVHLKQATQTKIDAVRKHLGMTEPEAEFFVKEMEQLRSINKELKAQVASLTADKTRLEQQCDSRSAHAMTLINENKRLLEQVSELRKQATLSDQDMWKLKQELATAKRMGAKVANKQAALSAERQSRPEFQVGPSRPATLAASTARVPGQDITNADKSHAAGGSKQHARNTKLSTKETSPQSLAAQYQQLTVDSSQQETGIGKTRAAQARNKSSRSSNTTANVQAAATIAAVQEAAAHLEELRRSALQQALASRQQRLATTAGLGAS